MDHPPQSRPAQWLLFLAVAVVVLSSAHPGPAFPVRTNASPQVLVLQPGPVNGTDTFLLNAQPAWNFGDNASLVVGYDATNGSVSRSLLSFNLSSIPANATILN
ncbi:MAG: DNRLRE domain-containing protein, partial [Candidatus Thermoplasmatota archaeon]